MEPTRPQFRRLPDRLPQQTFAEARVTAQAICNSTADEAWQEGQGELCLYFDPGAQHRIIFYPAGNAVSSPAELRRELNNLDSNAVFVLFVLIGTAVQEPGSFEIEIDDVIRLLRLTVRNSVARTEARRQVWNYLRLLSRLCVVGCRNEVYLDPRTGRKLKLTSHDALIATLGKKVPSEAEEDAPVRVTIAAGPWLDRFRRNPRVLQTFGDVLTLAAIPGGKPSGAWARAIGLALQQIWREQASKALVTQTGEPKRYSVRFRRVTRRQLLSLFPPQPSLGDVLKSEHPGRVIEYCELAFDTLEDKGFFQYCRAVAPGRTESRYSRVDAFLDEELDIRPGPTLTMNILAIRRPNRPRRKARSAALSNRSQSRTSQESGRNERL